MPRHPLLMGCAPARAAPASAGSLARDALAGITLAAITIPEQMATARLGGFDPQLGFFAFVAATLGFAAFGASRVLTAGADSTITPIFAGALAVLAAGGASLATTAPLLALLVGILLVSASLLRLGWVADLLSTPVITGFLAGIAVHILVSQLPGLLGIPSGGEGIVAQLGGIYDRRSAIDPATAMLGGGVLATMLLCERFAPRLPGALIGLGLATAAVLLLGLKVPVLGGLPGGPPRFAGFDLAWGDLRRLLPLALILSLIVMMQTATVSRSFRDPAGREPDVGRDFLGLGAANLLAGAAGAFPVNASPPRTAVVVESGGGTQRAALVAAALVLALALSGGALLAHVPEAALAGVLLFVAQRIFHGREMLAIARQSPPEFALIVVTALAIVLLPIETGVAIGIGLSLVQGVWVTTRSRPVEFGRIAGTTIWWPPEKGGHVESEPDTLVLGFQAPLLFANADIFLAGVTALLDAREPDILVLEAGGVAAVDYTAAQALLALIATCRARGIAFAVARVESVRAQNALTRFGVLDALGPDRLFHSVDEAVTALRAGVSTRGQG